MKYNRIFIFSLVIFIFSFTIGYAGDVLFETLMPWYFWWSETSWGTGGFTYVSTVAISYKPTVDQEVCTIKPGVYRSGNATDGIIMTVRESLTGYPTHGQIIGTSTVPASQVSGPPLLPQQTVYTSFTFSPCLNFTANTHYQLVLARTQPGGDGHYVSQISNLIWYPETKFWAFVPVNGFWQEKFPYMPALRLEGPEPQNKEPVIIVPGILGSRLNKVSDGDEVWPNIGQLGLPGPDNYLNDLKLDSNGSEILDMNSSEIIESVLGNAQYGNLIERFKDNDYQLNSDLFLFPYDWRLDIATASLEFDSVVNQALTQSPTGKVNIIAHSMGGLVVKDYLMRNGDSIVNKLIFAGTPHLGAPKAFNALNYGDDFDLKFLFLGLNKNKAKEIGQNMPGVYELLPSREYIDQAGSYVQDERSGSLQSLTYDQTNQFMTSDPILPDYRNLNILNLADQFHQSHDSWLPQSANVYNLIGCRAYDTVGSFKIEEGDSIDIDSITGDGTVPFVSANYMSVGDKYFVSYPVTKINHLDLIRDERTVNLIYNLITTIDPLVLPNGISKAQDDCDAILDQIKRLRFSTHSPVNLHVYDNLGNHTGLTSEGNIETNIPDSDFIQVGDSSFVFVPDGAEYSVEIDAYAIGSFDFKVKTLKNGQVDESVIYENISINDPNLEANFEFTNIASSSNLDVDENGDGEIDIGYSSAGERILYHGIENVIADINMAYELGWILTEKERDHYLRKLAKVIKIEKRIEILEEKLPDSQKKEKRIEYLEKKIDGLLAIQFLKDLEKSYNKGEIKEQAYNLIKEDILWLLEH